MYSKLVIPTAKIFISVMIFCFAFLLTSCEKNKPLAPVSSIVVSQGSYVGVVHLSWENVPDAYYNIERMGPDGQWIGAGSVSASPFDDYGLGLPDNKIQAGVKYSYRITSGSSEIDDSEYAYASEKGWIYDAKPIIMTAKRNDNASVTIDWSDTNQYLINQNTNLLSFSYTIKRRYEDETNFTDIHHTDNKTTVQDLSFTDVGVAQDKKVYYKIEGSYRYLFKNMDWGTSDGIYNVDFNEAEANGNLESNYTITNLNSLPNSNDGYGFVELKNINSDMYAATIPKAVFGPPVIYKLNGSSWQNISSSYPSGLQQNFEKISICGNATTIWCAGISDSAYIYAHNGSWSNNLATSNLGLGVKPDNLSVEYFNNTLFALCDYNGKLEVYSNVQNAVWNKDVTLENNASVMNLGFEIFNGKLYVYYLVINSAYNSTLKIKHFNGSSWQTDLDFTRDDLMNVHISIDNTGDIYFTSSSQRPANWKGNVFKVSSNTTAQELVGSSNTWLIFPENIAFDNLDNPVVLYFKYISQSQAMEMHLAVYEGNEWKNIAGDFTDYIAPADIKSNNGIYFIYGDGANTVNGYPKTLKSEFLTK